jgi:trigger factor
VKATVEPLEGNKVKLSVEVDEQEFERAVNDAFKKIAREVRIPGFRPGKAPRRILEARLGTDAARSQALHDSLPEYYAQAVREHDVDVIAAPEIDITDGEDTGSVSFDAVVEVRPRVSVPGYANLRVTVASPLPTDEEVADQLDRLRAQHGELETVGRPAIDDDFVTIDIAGSQDGEALEGLTADDYLYQVGSGALVPELDANLHGTKPGDIVEFDADHPSDADATLHFRVLVKEVKERKLPDLDDAFAEEASEFSTLTELRESTEKRIRQVKQVQAQMALREQVGEALAELVDEEVPEPLIASEMQERLNDLGLRLQAQGLSVEQWLAGTGRDEQQFVAELREAAERSAKVDLALRAVAEAQEIETTDEDLAAEYEQVAARLELDPKKVRQQFERADQVQAIRSDIRKRKALEWLIDTVEVVDEGGQPIDRETLVVDVDSDEGDASQQSASDQSSETEPRASADVDPERADDEDEEAEEDE